MSRKYFIGKVSRHGFEGLEGEPFDNQNQATQKARTLSKELSNRDGAEPHLVLRHFLVIEANSPEEAAGWASNPNNAEYLEYLKENRIYEGIRLVGEHQNPSRILILEKS